MSDTVKVGADTPDDESPEWTAEDLAKAKSAAEYYGKERLARLMGSPPSPGSA